MHAGADASFIEKLKGILGERNVISEREKLIDFSHDEYSQDDIRVFPRAVAMPVSAEEVSRVLKLCSENKVPVTARGGGTGLCGGCVPAEGGVVLSLSRMNKILEVDKNNLTVTAEAGVPLTEFFKAVSAAGLFFPPHPGDESAAVGGVIATNAGGARAVKHGVVRNFVRGLEVVLADGEIINTGGKFIKNSSGYSLMNLFIGSEGTLGVITKAVIGVIAPPECVYTLIAPYENLQDAISTVPAIVGKGIMPMAVEFMEKEPLFASESLLGKTWPARGGSADLMIIVDGTGEEEVMKLSEKIGEICLEHNALDVFVADTKQKQDNALEIRSGMYEALKHGMLEILDVCVPRGSIADFVSEVQKIAEEEGMWLPSYGHAYDGNVHVHIMKSRWVDGSWEETAGWNEKYSAVRRKVHEAGRSFSGIVSGEHGIGLVKKEYLEDFIGKRQVGLMREIKKIFDPGGILNPGKIFDAAG